MVSSRMNDLPNIDELYEQMMQSSFNVNEYRSDECHDAAFDMVTVETGVAGIASQLLTGTLSPKKQQRVLGLKLLDGNNWHLLNGTKCDLSSRPELLIHARNIVALQCACKERLQEGKVQ